MKEKSINLTANKKNDSEVIIKHSLKRLIPSQAMIYFTGLLPGFVCTFLAGNLLDASALAAISYAEPLRSILSIFVGMLTLGCTILVSKSTGKGDIKQTNAIYAAGLLFALVVGVILNIIFFTTSNYIGQLLQIDPSSLVDFCDYVKGWSFVCIPTLSTIVFLIYLQIYSQQKSIYIYIIIFTIINVTLGNILSNLLNLGVFGIGLSSGISMFISTTFLMIWLQVTCKQIKFSFRFFSIRTLLDVIKFGSPNAVFSLCSTFKIIIRNAVIQEVGGVTGMAALNVGGAGVYIFDAVSMGIVGSIVIIANIYIGSKNSKKLYKLMNYFFKTAFKIMLVCVVVWLISCRFFIAAFTTDPQVTELSLRFAFFYSPCMIVLVYPETLMQIYQSLNRIVLVNIMYFLDSFLNHVVVILLLKNYLLLDAVWVSFIVSDLILCSVIFFISAFKKGGIPHSAEDFLWLDKDFFPDHILSYSALSLKDVVSCSKVIFTDLEKLGIEYKRVYLCSLTCEEIGVDVYTQSRTKRKKKKYMVEFNIVIDKSDIFLQTVDNADSFKAKIYQKIMESDDETYHYGIRTAVKLSPKIVYQNAAALNTFTIMYPSTKNQNLSNI